MKQLISIILLGVLAFSFLNDAGIFSFQDDIKIEISKDFDGEEELQDKTSKKDKFSSPSFFSQQFFSTTENKPTSWLSANIVHISYEVEIRPPRV